MIQEAGRQNGFSAESKNDFAFGPFDMKMVFDQKKCKKRKKTKPFFVFFVVY
jgi:hypothetical protein